MIARRRSSSEVPGIRCLGGFQVKRDIGQLYGNAMNVTTMFETYLLMRNVMVITVMDVTPRELI
jgi:hypothetical protein